LVLDLGWYKRTPSSNTSRAFELDHFPIVARRTVGTEPLWCRLHSDPLLRRLPLPRRWRTFRERNFNFDSAVLDLPDNTYLDGYWQSYLYFEDVADLIRFEATPSLPAGPKDMVVSQAIIRAESVSVHVRRGDYVRLKTAASVHGTCSPEYYLTAMATVASLVPNAHFFVFSDDPEWTRRHLTPPGPTTFVDHNGPEAAFQDLRLMALCKHNVIANSSFSWWGAWLNPGKEKVVISPKLWFADGRPTPTLMPSKWSRL
jgi:hypothetical protein